MNNIDFKEKYLKYKLKLKKLDYNKKLQQKGGFVYWIDDDNVATHGPGGTARLLNTPPADTDNNVSIVAASLDLMAKMKSMKNTHLGSNSTNYNIEEAKFLNKINGFKQQYNNEHIKFRLIDKVHKSAEYGPVKEGDIISDSKNEKFSYIDTVYFYSTQLNDVLKDLIISVIVEEHRKPPHTRDFDQVIQLINTITSDFIKHLNGQKSYYPDGRRNQNDYFDNKAKKYKASYHGPDVIEALTEGVSLFKSVWTWISKFLDNLNKNLKDLRSKGTLPTNHPINTFDGLIYIGQLVVLLANSKAGDMNAVIAKLKAYNSQDIILILFEQLRHVNEEVTSRILTVINADLHKMNKRISRALDGSIPLVDTYMIKIYEQVANIEELASLKDYYNYSNEKMCLQQKCDINTIKNDQLLLTDEEGNEVEIQNHIQSDLDVNKVDPKESDLENIAQRNYVSWKAYPAQHLYCINKTNNTCDKCMFYGDGNSLTTAEKYLGWRCASTQPSTRHKDILQVDYGGL